MGCLVVLQRERLLGRSDEIDVLEPEVNVTIDEPGQDGLTRGVDLVVTIEVGSDLENATVLDCEVCPRGVAATSIEDIAAADHRACHIPSLRSRCGAYLDGSMSTRCQEGPSHRKRAQYSYLRVGREARKEPRLVHRSYEPEFFRFELDMQATKDAAALRRRAIETEDLVLDLTELEPLPKALVGSYLIG